MRLTHLGKHLSECKDGRTVHLGRLFSSESHSGHDVSKRLAIDVRKRTGENILRFNLSEDQSGQNGGEEHGEDLVLESLDRITQLEESQSDNQLRLSIPLPSSETFTDVTYRDSNMSEESCPLVVCVSPQSNVG